LWIILYIGESTLSGCVRKWDHFFHPDTARLDLRKKLQHLRALKLSDNSRSAFADQRVDLEIVLGKIDTYSDKLLHGTVSLVVALRRPRLGTMMPLSRGRPQSSRMRS